MPNSCIDEQTMKWNDCKHDQKRYTTGYKKDGILDICRYIGPRILLKAAIWKTNQHFIRSEPLFGAN